MDSKVSDFLQLQARKVITDVFSAGHNPDSLAACFSAQLAFYDTMERVLIEATPPERSIKCSSGCSACCRQKVAATIPEAIGIADWLRTQGGEERRRVSDAARKIHEQTRDLSDFDRVKTQLCCPLLKARQCSAYDVRPISCRMAYSFSRTRCEKFYLRNLMNVEIPHYELPAELHKEVLLGFSEGLEAVNLDGGLVELSSALALLLEDDNLPAEYLAGKPVFMLAKIGRFREDSRHLADA